MNTLAPPAGSFSALYLSLGGKANYNNQFGPDMWKYFKLKKYRYWNLWSAVYPFVATLPATANLR